MVQYGCFSTESQSLEKNMFSNQAWATGLARARVSCSPYVTPLWKRLGAALGCFCRLRRGIPISQTRLKGQNMASTSLRPQPVALSGGIGPIRVKKGIWSILSYPESYPILSLGPDRCPCFPALVSDRRRRTKSYRSLWKEHSSGEERPLEKISSQGAKPGAWEQFLLPCQKARVHLKGVFFSQIPVSILALGRGMMEFAISFGRPQARLERTWHDVRIGLRAAAPWGLSKSNLGK